MAGLVGMVAAPVGLDSSSVRLLLLLLALAFLLHAKPPQNEISSFMRPSASESTTSIEGRGLQVAAPQYATSFAINSGSPKDYVASNGQTFIADNYVAGGTTTTWKQPTEKTDDPGLYETERYGYEFEYNIPNLENGVWEVKIYEAEQWFQEPRQRLMNVTFNSQTALYLQPFMNGGGKDKASIGTVRARVLDHTMHIKFAGMKDNAKVNAISGVLILAAPPETTPPVTTPPVVATPTPSTNATTLAPQGVAPPPNVTAAATTPEPNVTAETTLPPQVNASEAATTPNPTPEATPEPTPEATPEPTPEATPEPTPEATPEATSPVPTESNPPMNASVGGG